MADATATETTAPETIAVPNDVKIEELGPTRKRLSITVPAEKVDEKLEESMGTLAVSTSLPGFRKGRAPRHLIEKRFGTAVRAETKNQLVAEAYTTALEENKIRVIGEPEPSEEMKTLELTPGKPLSFSVEIEIVPDFTIPDLSSVEIKKPVLDITDKMIDEETERQLIRFGNPIRIEENFAAGDRLLGHAIVHKDGQSEPLFQHEQTLIVVPTDADGGKGNVLGLMVDGLAGILAGKKVGDEFDIHTVGPESHERDDIRGAKLHIHFKINVGERIEPATTQALIDIFGLGTEENLREQVRIALEQRRDQEQMAAMREQLHDWMVKNIDFDLPEKLSANQLARNIERQRMELLYRGLSVEDVETQLAQSRSASESMTRNRLKLFFILQKLAEDHKIQVTEQEVNGQIAAIAASRGERPERLKSELARLGRLNEVALQILEHKTADRVLSDLKTADITAEEWNQMVADRAKANPG